MSHDSSKPQLHHVLKWCSHAHYILLAIIWSH